VAGVSISDDAGSGVIEVTFTARRDVKVLTSVEDGSHGRGHGNGSATWCHARWMRSTHAAGGGLVYRGLQDWYGSDTLS